MAAAGVGPGAASAGAVVRDYPLQLRSQLEVVVWVVPRSQHTSHSVKVVLISPALVCWWNANLDGVGSTVWKGPAKLVVVPALRLFFLPSDVDLECLGSGQITIEFGENTNEWSN